VRETSSKERACQHSVCDARVVGDCEVKGGCLGSFFFFCRAVPVPWTPHPTSGVSWSSARRAPQGEREPPRIFPSGLQGGAAAVVINCRHARHWPPPCADEETPRTTASSVVVHALPAPSPRAEPHVPTPSSPPPPIAFRGRRAGCARQRRAPPVPAARPVQASTAPARSPIPARHRNVSASTSASQPNAGCPASAAPLILCRHRRQGDTRATPLHSPRGCDKRCRNPVRSNHCCFFQPNTHGPVWHRQPCIDSHGSIVNAWFGTCESCSISSPHFKIKLLVIWRSLTKFQ
jgi:hypothetical protein